MAFCGHVSTSGHIVLRDEVFSGLTRINRAPSSDELDSPMSISSENVLVDNEEIALRKGSGSSRTYIVTDNQCITPNGSGCEDSCSYSPPPVNGTRSMSAGSLYSWSDMYGGLKQSGSQSMVPSLALGSKASSLSVLRHMGAIKVGREPDAAYENWYSAKEQQRQRKQERIKAERDEVQNKIEERKRQAQLCYEDWLRNKARQASKHRMQNHLQIAQYRQACSMKSDAGKPNRNASTEEIRQVVQNWWLKKQEQKQRQIEAKRRAEMQKALEEKHRKELAEMAWEKWMSKVGNKPKPVPMNQGIDSLRGTISQLYINPQLWQGSIKRQATPKY